MTNQCVRIGRPQSAAERTMQLALDEREVLVEMTRCLFFSTMGRADVGATCRAWDSLTTVELEEWCETAVEQMRAFAINLGPDVEPDADPDPGATRPEESLSIESAGALRVA